MKRILKTISGQLLLFLTFLTLSTMLWGWLFSVRTNTTPDKKVTVYIDCDAVRDVELAARLEEDLPEGIRMVQVHPFSYALFDTSAFTGADLFIVPESKAEEYRDSFAAFAVSYTGVLTLENGAVGIKIYDTAADRGGADAYITYVNASGEKEDFYLFYGASSLHFAGNENAVDNAAAQIANRLLTLDQGEE